MRITTICQTLMAVKCLSTLMTDTIISQNSMIVSIKCLLHTNEYGLYILLLVRYADIRRLVLPAIKVTRRRSES